jgi:hypothetical protein
MIQAGASDEIREFYEIMGSEFSKNMDNKPNEEYGISALFSTHNVISAKGVLYCSEKNKHNGINLALSPEIIDRKFNFKRAAIAELWKFGEFPEINFTNTAERDQGIPLVYNKVKNPDFSVEKMINRYENKGIDPTHIIKVLVESNHIKI